MKKNWVTLLDESTLVGDGWSYGFSGQTLWKKDSSGVVWNADVSPAIGMRAIRFRALDDRYHFSAPKYLEYNEYITMFRGGTTYES